MFVDWNVASSITCFPCQDIVNSSIAASDIGANGAMEEIISKVAQFIPNTVFIRNLFVKLFLHFLRFLTFIISNYLFRYKSLSAEASDDIHILNCLKFNTIECETC